MLVVGAGGALGSAVLAEALAAGRFEQVGALTAGPLASTLRGLCPLPQEALAAPGAALPAATETAIVVFERERHSNRRDDAFVRPDPAALLPLARVLIDAGVRHLLVVVPHAPALLPHALRHGLATLDEGAVAALGFSHLVFVRAARDAQARRDGSPLERFARWWLSQLRWMVPTSEQPLRVAALAQCVAELAHQLPHAAPGTRVLAPEGLWPLAQQEAGWPAAVAAWLAARAPT